MQYTALSSSIKQLPVEMNRFKSNKGGNINKRYLLVTTDSKQSVNTDGLNSLNSPR